MKKSQKQLIILGVLIAVMAGVYLRVLRPSSMQSGKAAIPAVSAVNAISQDQAAPIESPSVAKVSRAQQESRRASQRERAKILAWGRDPFTLSGTLGDLSGLSLTGILWDANDPIAVINDQMVRAGDKLDNYQIIEISHDRVSVTDGIETFKLQIAP